MVDEAAYVFQGEFIAQEKGKKISAHFSEGLDVVTFHFQVTKWIKGKKSDLAFKDEQVLFQQWAGISSNLSKNKTNFFPYKKGNEYVLFLNKLSPNTGLTTPLGLGKGIFPISSETGEQKVRFPFGRKKMNLQVSKPGKASITTENNSIPLDVFLKKIDTEL